MRKYDESILSHIGRYGLSLRSVIEAEFFAGSTCDHIINRLVAEGRIVSVPGIPGGLNYYRLSLTEARARGVPEHRARPKRGIALRQAIQVLWFCCMSDLPRKKLERKAVAENFGKGSGSGKPHCAEASDKQSLVYRVYSPGPHSRDEYLLKAIRSDTEKGMERPQLREWIEAKAFAAAILVETKERKERLKRLISKTGPYEIWIHIEVVPGLATLAEALRKKAEAKRNGSSNN